MFNPKSKLNSMPCKFAKFCSVNNLSNLSGYFPAFDHTSLQYKQNGTVAFMNIGCLSNDDGEGNENNPSCQNKCAFFFFFYFFSFISVNSLKMTKIYRGELP